MDAQSAFAEILDNLPRQHLRVRFRNHFGLPDSDFGKDTFARGSVLSPLDRRIGHLMQEEPKDLRAVVLSGPAGDLGMTRSSPTSSDTLGSLLQEDRVLLIHGATARLYAYLAPGETEAWVRRVAVARETRPGSKPAGPALSRRQRAAAAGKQKPAKRNVNRRR